MRVRLVKPGKRNRVVLRGNSCENLLHLEAMALGMGLQYVGIVGYWMHVLFWWRQTPTPKTPKPPGNPELN